MGIGPEERKAFLEGCGEVLPDENVDFESEDAMAELFAGLDGDNIMSIMNFMVESGVIDFEEARGDEE